jgi:predicted GH43/DUF377 family glycosyl hydrolase
MRTLPTVGALLAASLLLTSCGRYADFTLPVLPQTGQNVSYQWNVYPDPVLSRGAAGWNSTDALNPSVVETGGVLYNFYSGYDGKIWSTGLATSNDGMHWEQKGKVLAPDPATWEGGYIAANGTALRIGNEFLYWYQAGRSARIGFARSKDGITWTKLANPVLGTGPRGSWDERATADPYVVQIGGTFYMYYLGEDRARRQRLGVARSRDGITWQKSRSNPILELGGPGTFDELGLGEPAVWQSHGSYWMLFTGRDRAENRRLGLARSQDGVHWTRFSESPVLSGNDPWNSKTVCDPTVRLTGADIQVWFGGGDLAHPVENVHGQIGFAILQLSVAAANLPR